MSEEDKNVYRTVSAEYRRTFDENYPHYRETRKRYKKQTKKIRFHKVKQTNEEMRLFAKKTSENDEAVPDFNLEIYNLQINQAEILPISCRCQSCLRDNDVQEDL